MDTNYDEDQRLATGDLLVSERNIHPFLVSLGMPAETDVYYLKRSGWPIGNTGGDGGELIASKRRLIRHLGKLTRGTTAA